MQSYQDYLAGKLQIIKPSGFDVDPTSLNPYLFPFQREVVRIALKMGRFSVFERYGCGKALQLLEWCNQISQFTGEPTLILTPLAVAAQTAREARKFGIPNVHLCRKGGDIKHGINIINYESMHKLDLSRFAGVACDEISSIRNDSTDRFQSVVEGFRNTPYKTGWSATPCPNDFEEMGSQAEFMGVMPKSEMLATFFSHDSSESQKWVLMKWGEKLFWKWIAQWAIYLRKPSDLNPAFDDSPYQLPAHNEQHIRVNTPIPAPEGKLFFDQAKSSTEKRYVNKISLQDRCQAVADLANGSNEQWLIWCWTNDESRMLTKLIDGAVEVKGSDSVNHKESAVEGFQGRNIRVLVSKPTIFGYGLNFQNCHNQCFVGLDDRWEAIEQAIHRLLRFGQTETVNTYYVNHILNGNTAANHARKSSQFDHMTNSLVKAMQSVDYANLSGNGRHYDEYNPTQEIKLPSWLVA